MTKKYPKGRSSFYILFGVITLLFEAASSSSFPPYGDPLDQSPAANKFEGEVNQDIPTYLIPLVKHLQTEYLSLNQRLLFVENKSAHQENEIVILKYNLSSILDVLPKQQPNKLEDSIEIEPVNNLKEDTSPITRHGRPARLLPLQLINGPKNDTPYEIRKMIPTSCEDLSRIGHTINGIFLVNNKAADTNSSKLKLSAVFCDFQPPPYISNSVLGKPLGFLSVKSYSHGVYFYVQHNNIRDEDVAKVITFNLELLNIGKAMDISTGVFTAPTSGIYQFSFTIAKYGFVTNEVYVHLRKNSKKIGTSITNGGFYSGLASFQAILPLKKGDRVDLHKEKGRIGEDYPKCNHFSGMLLDEDMGFNN